MTRQVITIDGPVASGKGTVASLVAKELGWSYLDSGALYRLAALSARNQSLQLDDEESLASLAESMVIQFKQGHIYLNGEEVAQVIRQESIGLIASQIAVFPKVREALFLRQKQFAEPANLVADGRDMGSVVFPNAILKVYLTASVERRAKRRAQQIGVTLNTAAYQKIYDEILQRDQRDENRCVAPLEPAKGAKILDSSELSIEESVKKIINWYQLVSRNK